MEDSKRNKASKFRPVCGVILLASIATRYLPTSPHNAWWEERATIPTSRVVFLTGEIFGPRLGRFMPLFSALPTDVTQIYDELDSEDSPDMEKPAQNCSVQPIVHPTCNDVHMIDLTLELASNQTNPLSSKGFWRHAWEHREATFGSNIDSRMVFKTLHTQHRFEEAFYELQQLDAHVMERLTSSPYVIDMYSFCGLSVLTDFAGQHISHVVDRSRRKDRLKLAKQVARGVADLHGAGIIHNDLNPANLAFSERKQVPVLFDFNIAVLRESQCSFVATYLNPQWRAPEEQVLGSSLTEKVDIYALGNVFFRFAVGKPPWATENPRLSAEEKNAIAEKKLNGLSIPPYDLPPRNKDPATMALVNIMNLCFEFVPKKRPSARRILSMLNSAIQNTTHHSRRHVDKNSTSLTPNTTFSGIQQRPTSKPVQTKSTSLRKETHTHSPNSAPNQTRSFNASTPNYHHQ